MAYTVRSFKGRPGQWEADIRVRLVSGEIVRKRIKVPAKDKAAAVKWTKAHELELLAKSTIPPIVQDDLVFDEFFEIFNRNPDLKHSARVTRRGSYERYIKPVIGHVSLNKLQQRHVDEIVRLLSHKSASRHNNVLSVLRQLVSSVNRRYGSGTIDLEMPRNRKIAHVQLTYYTDQELTAILEASQDVYDTALVLLGADAGLRAGEIQALRQSDLVSAKNLLSISRSIWGGVEGTTKNRKIRYVPTTGRLMEVLKSIRDDYFLRQETLGSLRWRMKRLNKASGVGKPGIHILRHTFCSRLAAAGVPTRTIQELAGHSRISTTERYMHLAPGQIDAAIRLLER